MKKRIVEVIYHETRLELDPTETEIVLEAGLIALGYVKKEDEIHTINFECGMSQGEGFLETVEIKVRGGQSQGSVGQMKEEIFDISTIKGGSNG